MDGPTTRPRMASIAPFFIVRDVAPAIAFYRDRLGFDLAYSAPDGDPFFAILDRDDVRIMLKAITPDVPPQPNHTRHPWARWDAYVHTPDPDALAEELASRGATFRQPLADDDDRLRGFTIEDVDGYVLYFGRPTS